MDSPTLRSFNYEQFFLEKKMYLEFRFSEPTILSVTTTSSPRTESFEPREKSQKPGRTATSENYKATKNIAKNFGKAISSFATSNLAVTYLIPILQKNNLSMEDFLNYMNIAKKSIQSIDTFRNLLLINPTDSPLLIAQKKAFQAIGIIFIKYFSVNWITHGKISNKLIYLKYRFKVLRRLQNPASFTYLQSPKVPKTKRSKN